MLVHGTDINALTAHNTQPYSKIFLIETIVLKCQRENFKNKFTPKIILCFVDRASLYNLANKSN